MNTLITVVIFAVSAYAIVMAAAFFYVCAHTICAGLYNFITKEL